MINLEWAHVIFAGVGAVIGGISGIVAGVWRVARIEDGIKERFRREVIDAEKALAQSIAQVERDVEAKVEALAEIYDETFKALRTKIGEVELHTERFFLSKDGFDDFRKEYREDMKAHREDMRSLIDKVDHLYRSKP